MKRTPPPTPYRLFAICPGGLDEVLKKEIEKLPATVTHAYPGGIEFEGTLETAYLATLKLRTASRVLLLLGSHKKIFKPEELYSTIRSYDWEKHFSAESTFAIFLTESHTKERRIPVNPQFWALKAKDAVADYFLQKHGTRPNVDRKDPDIAIRMHLHDQILKVYLDLSGPSLHERGYRQSSVEAPIKENLAAGLLLLSDWQYTCNEGFGFLDPFCGSGTLLIEAALIATRTAPGLLRSRFGFFGWKDHDPDLFEQIHARLKSERILDPAKLPLMVGCDREKDAVQATRSNLEAAGMSDFVRLKVNAFQDTTAFQEKGLIVMNPPYGIRLEEVEGLKETYRGIGSTLKHKYPGWWAGVITSEKSLMHSIGLRPEKKWPLHNGGLESQYSLFKMY